jgi:hypothetical protein
MTILDHDSLSPSEYIEAQQLCGCQIGRMEQTRTSQDLTTHSLDTSIPLEGGEFAIDKDVPSDQGSLSITLTMLPYPTPSMDMASILNPMPNPIPRLPRRSCNKAYTLEQIHFIQYCKEDLKLPWPETEARYIERFPDPARDVSIVGLQCRYYRAQKYPMLDIEGKPVLNDNGTIIMRNLTVRERGQKGGLIVPILDGERRPLSNEKGRVLMRELTEEELHGPLGRNLSVVYQRYFKLVDRVPEHAAKYGWVRNAHNKLAVRNGMFSTSPSS